MQSIYIIAGESSGDLLGAELIQSFKKKYPLVKISGIGGPLMEKEGLMSLFPTSELSVMGLFELIPHLFHIFKRMDQTVQDICSKKPDVVITIDSSGFCHRVVKKLKKNIKYKNDKNIPCIHYVAPQVWAWREKRAEKLSSFLDGLLCLLPFEPPYFTKHNLKTYFVGHPLTNNLENITKGQENDVLKILLLPGSRQSEVKSLLPIFLDVILKIEIEKPFIKKVEYYLPTLPHLESLISSLLKDKPFKISTTTNYDLKNDWFKNANFAIAASGTVSLELSKYLIPHLIAYKMNKLTAFFVKRLIKTPYASLINILSQKEVVPECLMENCTPDYIYKKLLTLNTVNKNEMIDAINKLKCPVENKTPSDFAVQKIEEILKDFNS
ncbi:MAG: lipid-A-disaccharide synthase [Proteobacteria bacterium]|nr:lipid-A-disaccharide synthase [Pseudomonadota bacterium]